MSPFDRWCRFERSLARLEAGLLVAAGGLLVVLIFTGVLSRFLLHFSIAGSEELARYLFVWSVPVGAALAIHHDEHGGLGLLVARLSGRQRRWADRWVWALVTGLLLVLWGGSLEAVVNGIASGQRSSASGLPVWTVEAGIALGLGLMTLHALGRCWRGLREGGRC